jgi:hypothetical protein
MRGSATRGASPTDTTHSPAATLQTLGGGAVTIEGGLWARRQATNRDAACPTTTGCSRRRGISRTFGSPPARPPGATRARCSWTRTCTSGSRPPPTSTLGSQATDSCLTWQPPSTSPAPPRALPGAGRSRRHPDRRARDRPERGSRIPLGPRAPRGRRGPARGGVPGRHVVVGPPALSPLPFRAAAGSAAGRAHGDPVLRLGESKPGRHARVGPAGYNLIAVGLATASFVTSIKRRDA